MGATVELDGRAVGVATDQWLRYAFPVAKLLNRKPGASHELSVTFDNSIDTHGRYMGCSGGWDWAPIAVGGGAIQTPLCILTFVIPRPNYAERRLSTSAARLGQAPMSIEWMVTPDRSPTSSIREQQTRGSGGSPPGPLPTHLHTGYMACSECSPAR
jgi:hypothetical protein